MKKLFDYIEALKVHTRLDTNVKIAEYLNVTRQYITTLKYGNAWLSNDKCLLIAKALGINVNEIVMTINAEKSANQAERDEWLKQAKLVETPIAPPLEFLPDGSPKRRNK